MPEQSKADRQGNPVAQAMQAVARNGHQQKRGKHQIEERMEVARYPAHNRPNLTRK